MAMKRFYFFFFIYTLAWAGCAAHNHDNEIQVDVEATRSPKKSGIGAVADTAACEIPSSFNPALHASVPEVASESKDVKVDRFDVHIDLEKDGRLRVNVAVKLENSAMTPATAAVGYILRTPIGQERRFGQIAFDTGASTTADVKTCEKESPSNLVQPYSDFAHYAKIPIGPGGFGEIEISFVARAEPSAAPTTLFGYRDMFALNWKNWAWTYTKSDEFKEIADDLGLFYGAFGLGDADRTRIVISAEPSSGGLRGLSHEQNLERLPEANAYAWSFDRDDRPTEVELEYSSGTVSTSKEKEVFTRMAKNRPNDLRALIHLTDLHFLEGNHKKRIEVLKRLLAAWDANSKEQLLDDLNDLRPAAYVGLVRTLSALKQDQNAKLEAQKGAKLAGKPISSDKGAIGERTALAAKWLEQAAGQ
jgi:hypothetical protein